ncbi:hypothetical protein BJY04DRAFT_223993 [Aspergillus karnatakaensis]|uniref:uncharacterized protein n=1 Tax=Aspergillus karnatakaensis TaxID=1810916 RepID=UPI003CCD73B4
MSLLTLAEELISPSRTSLSNLMHRCRKLHRITFPVLYNLSPSEFIWLYGNPLFNPHTDIMNNLTPLYLKRAQTNKGMAFHGLQTAVEEGCIIPASFRLTFGAPIANAYNLKGYEHLDLLIIATSNDDINMPALLLQTKQTSWPSSFPTSTPGSISAPLAETPCSTTPPLAAQKRYFGGSSLTVWT